MKQSHKHDLYQTLGDMRQSEIGICIFGFSDERFSMSDCQKKELQGEIDDIYLKIWEDANQLMLIFYTFAPVFRPKSSESGPGHII